MAKQAHAEYRANQLARKPLGDPALAPWEDLLPLFKDSNRGQADDIKNKLAMIGLRILPKGEGGRELELTDEEVELLAEIEHGATWLNDCERVGNKVTGTRIGVYLRTSSHGTTSARSRSMTAKPCERSRARSTRSTTASQSSRNERP